MLRLSGLDELSWKRVALELVTDHDRYRISFPEGDLKKWITLKRFLIFAFADLHEREAKF